MAFLRWQVTYLYMVTLQPRYPTSGSPWMELTPSQREHGAWIEKGKDRFPHPVFFFFWLTLQGYDLVHPHEKSQLTSQKADGLAHEGPLWPSRRKEEAPWGFLSGNLPPRHRQHQGHQNRGTFPTHSLLPDSEFGCFMALLCRFFFLFSWI